MIHLFSVVWVELRDPDKQRAVALAVNRALAGLGEDCPFNVGVRDAKPSARSDRGGWDVVLEGPELASHAGWRITRVEGHPDVFYRRRLVGPDEESAAFLEGAIEQLVAPLKMRASFPAADWGAHDTAS